MPPRHSSNATRTGTLPRGSPQGKPVSPFLSWPSSNSNGSGGGADKGPGPPPLRPQAQSTPPPAPPSAATPPPADEEQVKSVLRLLSYTAPNAKLDSSSSSTPPQPATVFRLYYDIVQLVDRLDGTKATQAYKQLVGDDEIFGLLARLVARGLVDVARVQQHLRASTPLSAASPITKEHSAAIRSWPEQEGKALATLLSTYKQQQPPVSIALAKLDKLSLAEQETYLTALLATNKYISLLMLVQCAVPYSSAAAAAGPASGKQIDAVFPPVKTGVAILRFLDTYKGDPRVQAVVKDPRYKGLVNAAIAKRNPVVESDVFRCPLGLSLFLSSVFCQGIATGKSEAIEALVRNPDILRAVCVPWTALSLESMDALMANVLADGDKGLGGETRRMDGLPRMLLSLVGSAPVFKTIWLFETRIVADLLALSFIAERASKDILPVVCAANELMERLIVYTSLDVEDIMRIRTEGGSLALPSLEPTAAVLDGLVKLVFTDVQASVEALRCLVWFVRVEYEPFNSKSAFKLPAPESGGDESAAQLLALMPSIDTSQASFPATDRLFLAAGSIDWLQRLTNTGKLYLKQLHTSQLAMDREPPISTLLLIAQLFEAFAGIGANVLQPADAQRQVLLLAADFCFCVLSSFPENRRGCPVILNAFAALFGRLCGIAPENDELWHAKLSTIAGDLVDVKALYEQRRQRQTKSSSSRMDDYCIAAHACAAQAIDSAILSKPFISLMGRLDKALLNKLRDQIRLVTAKSPAVPRPITIAAPPTAPATTIQDWQAAAEYYLQQAQSLIAHAAQLPEGPERQYYLYNAEKATNFFEQAQKALVQAELAATNTPAPATAPSTAAPPHNSIIMANDPTVLFSAVQERNARQVREILAAGIVDVNATLAGI